MHSEPEHLNKKSGLKKMVKSDINNFTNSLKHYFPTEMNGKTVKLIDFIKTVFFGQDYFKVSDLLWCIEMQNRIKKLWTYFNKIPEF